jgi:hypothetical protein
MFHALHLQASLAAWSCKHAQRYTPLSITVENMQFDTIVKIVYLCRALQVQSMQSFVLCSRAQKSHWYTLVIIRSPPTIPACQESSSQVLLVEILENILRKSSHLLLLRIRCYPLCWKWVKIGEPMNPQMSRILAGRNFSLTLARFVKPLVLPKILGD